MPRRKSRKKRQETEYSFLSIIVDDYKVRASAGPNLHVEGTAPQLRDDEEHAIYARTALELSGLCTDPPERAGDRYEITLHGETRDSGILKLRIKDLHRKDKDGIYEYRRYRSREYPAYDAPPDLGFLEKVRGEKRWSAWVTVSHQMITDALILLGGDKPVYVSIQEKKFNRTRWVRSLSVQTSDPAEE